MMKDWLQLLQEFRVEQRPCVLVTLMDVQGSAPGGVGAKMLVSQDGIVCGSIGGGAVELDAISRAVTLLRQGGLLEVEIPLSSQKQCCGGKVRLLFETFFQGPRLHLFGVGHVGAELANLLHSTRFHVSLIDDRETWVPPTALPEGSKVYRESSLGYIEQLEVDSQRDFALIMTPTHEQDYSILKACLNSTFQWIGLIGSNSKVKKFKTHLKKEGFTEPQRQGFTSPIGLREIGRNPREVALSIAHEILRVEGCRQEKKS